MFGFKSKRGFTITELLIVILIVAIIVGFMMTKLEGLSDGAAMAHIHSDLRVLRAGIESHYMHQSPLAYPRPGNPVSLCADVLTKDNPLIVGESLYDFAYSQNKCAHTEREYTYYLSPNEEYYVVFSVGANCQNDITGINNDGLLFGSNIDDIYASNGLGFNADTNRLLAMNK